MDIIYKPLDLAVNWIMGLFGWSMPSIGDGPEGEPFSMRTLVLSAFNKAKDWVMSLFSFDEAAEGVANAKKFSIDGLVVDAVMAIFTWFKGLLDIDWDKAIKNLAPDWVKDAPIVGRFFGGNGKATEPAAGQTLKDAIKLGLYDEKLIPHSEIDKQALEEGIESGLVQADMLKAILADEDLSKENTAYMEELLRKATTKGSLFVRDTGLHERLDKLMQPLMGTNGLQSGPALAYAPQTQVSNQTHQHNAKRIIHPISDLVRTQAWEAM